MWSNPLHTEPVLQLTRKVKRIQTRQGTTFNTTLRAAVHLGKDSDMNLRFVKNYHWKTTGQLFGETEKLIRGQTETTGIRLINFQDFEEGIDKLIAQSSLSTIHCQSLCLSPTLCSVWEEWETILLSPGRSKSNGIRQLF